MREGGSRCRERDRDRLPRSLAVSELRGRESDDRGTAGRTEAGRNRQDTAPGGHTARNMSRGVCARMHLAMRERPSGRTSGSGDRKERVRECEGCVCVSSGAWHWVKGWE